MVDPSVHIPSAKTEESKPEIHPDSEFISTNINQATIDFLTKTAMEEIDSQSQDNGLAKPDEKVECDICFVTLSSIRGLARHKKTHDENSSICCPHCQKRYVRRDQYFSHVLMHVNNIKDKEFKCPVIDCGFQSVGYNDMRSHFVEHDGKEDSLHCSECASVFKNSSRLWLHYHIHHGELLEMKQRLSEEFAKRKEEKEDTANVKRENSASYSGPAPKLKRMNGASREVTRSPEALACETPVPPEISAPSTPPPHSSTATLEEMAKMAINSMAQPLPHMPINPIQLALSCTTTVVKDLSTFLICQHCGILFVDLAMFLMHNSFHSSEGNPFCCAFCSVETRDRFEFTTHLLCTPHFYNELPTEES